MAWLRIDDQFFHHPKVLEAGDEAIGLWVRLLTWSGANLTDGFIPLSVLKLFAKRSLRRDIKRLVAVGLLHESDGGFQVHDYLDWNPTAGEVADKRTDLNRKRSEAGKRGAEKRWQKAKFANSKTDGKKMASAKNENGKTMAPSPSPSPYPIKNKDLSSTDETEQPKDSGQAVGSLFNEKTTDQKTKLSAEIQTVWGAYREQHPHCSATLKSNDRRYKLIKARLKDGFPVAALVKAISGYHKSPFHLGDNDNGTKYLDLGLILRDPEHVEKGIGFDNDPPLPKNGNRAKDPRDDWD